MNYAPEKPLPRGIGIIGLTVIGVTCIIGSGWLFGAYHAAKLAGPAAVFAWIIGGFAVALVAMTVVELATMFPAAGGMARYLNYSHGSFTGFIAGWANWIAILSSIPAEATASIQYLSSWHWQWCQQLFNTASGELTLTGIVASAVMTIVFFLLNYMTVKLFVRFLIATTIIKIMVPLITAGLLFATSFHADNFTTAQGIAPYGWSAVLTTIATCGIVFSFNGFQTIANFAGEAKNPHTTLPIAIISSIIFALILYVLLQVVFIGAIPPELLQANLWHGLNFSSPFAQLVLAMNLNIVLLLLYVDAFISPSVTGITYMGSAARMLYGMQQHGHMPGFIGKLHTKKLIPGAALWTTLIICLVFLFIFRSWSNLAAVISVATVISYLTGPIAAMSLRKIAPHLVRPVSIPGMTIIAPTAFVIISLILFWSRWPLTGEIIGVIFSGLFIYLYYQHQQGWHKFKIQLKSGLWLITYLFTIALISYLGDKEFGGINLLPAGIDQIIVAVAALGFYYWGINSAWMTPELTVAINQTSKKMAPILQLQRQRPINKSSIVYKKALK